MRKAMVILLLCFIKSNASAAVSLGTGFFITNDGYLVTNHHVIKDAGSISIRASRGRTLSATVAAIDATNDLALLKVDGVFDALPITSSRNAKPGTRVITMGFPLVSIQGGEPKITEGIVSSVTGLGNDPRVFQISVAIQPGNSGGPLVTYDGGVVGIVTAKLSALAVLKTTGSLPENVNYAIKSNYLLELISIIDGADKKLLKPRQKPFPDMEKLAEYVSKSIAIVVAEFADTKTELKKEPVETRKEEFPVAFPKSWLSLGSGNRFSIRQEGEYLQWVQTYGNNAGWISNQGEARRNKDDTFSGVMNAVLKCTPVREMCSIKIPIQFTLVSSRRIEGQISRVTRFDCNSCQAEFSGSEDIVWIPQ